MTKPFVLKATELEHYLETGDMPSAFNEMIENVLKLFREEGNSSFILGKVVIRNDLETADEED